MAADPVRTPHRRRLRRWLLAALTVPAVALAGALTGPTDPVLSATAAISSGTPAAATSTVDGAAVLAAVDDAAAEAGGSIAVVVLDGDAGQLVASADAQDP